MRFGLIHRLLTDALAALGLLSLVTSGQLDTWISMAICSAMVLAMLVPERAQGSAWLRYFGRFSSLGLLAVQTTRVLLGHDPFTIAVEFAAGLQLVRLATRRGAAHDQQIILLALLHLVAGTVLGGGLAYGLCFLGFLVVAPGSLVLSHLRREVEGNYRQGARDRTGLPVDVPRILRSRRVISARFLAATCSLSIPIFFFTAVLFVLFPRVGLSLLLINHARSERMVGFSDRVDLGKVGRLRSDPTIALRVHLPNLAEEPPARIPLYLRGAAFDTYDGMSWARDDTQVFAEKAGNRIWTNPNSSLVGDELMLVDLEPIKPPVIFLPSNATAFDVLTIDDHLMRKLPRITHGREFDFQYQSLDERGLRYRVFGTAEVQPTKLSEADRQRYLSLPAGLSARLRQLAKDWTADTRTPREAAEAVERRLRSEYRYDLDTPSGGRADPLEDFLFESRRGHCEYYSTSMAILLRTMGIPTRNVTGFIGGTFNRFGRFYAVRQGDAHSWVEVYLDGAGWRRFDPTPVSDSAPRAETSGALALLRDILEAASERWDRNVVGYDLEQQVAFFQSIRKQLGPAQRGDSDFRSYGRWLLAAGFLLAAATLLWRMRRRPVAKEQAPTAPTRREALLVVGLYRELEAELQRRGIPRPSHTPPLAYAMGLQALSHPVADEVMELTRVYLEVRFGTRSFDAADQADYRARLALLRRERAAA